MEEIKISKNIKAFKNPFNDLLSELVVENKKREKPKKYQNVGSGKLFNVLKENFTSNFPPYVHENDLKPIQSGLTFGLKLKPSAKKSSILENRSEYYLEVSSFNLNEDFYKWLVKNLAVKFFETSPSVPSCHIQTTLEAIEGNMPYIELLDDFALFSERTQIVSFLKTLLFSSSSVPDSLNEYLTLSESVVPYLEVFFNDVIEASHPEFKEEFTSRILYDLLEFVKEHEKTFLEDFNEMKETLAILLWIRDKKHLDYFRFQNNPKHYLFTLRNSKTHEVVARVNALTSNLSPKTLTFLNLYSSNDWFSYLLRVEIENSIKNFKTLKSVFSKENVVVYTEEKVRKNQKTSSLSLFYFSDDNFTPTFSMKRITTLPIKPFLKYQSKRTISEPAIRKELSLISEVSSSLLEELGIQNVEDLEGIFLNSNTKLNSLSLGDVFGVNVVVENKENDSISIITLPVFGKVKNLPKNFLFSVRNWWYD